MNQDDEETGENAVRMIGGGIFLSEILTGIVSGVIASIIVLVGTFFYEYLYRKKTEKCRLYELEYVGERDACAPPEYPRETAYVEPPHEKGVSEEFYETIDVVKLQFPFDVKNIQILEFDKPVYPTDDIENLPMGEPIYVNCKLSLGNDVPAFIVKCKTFRHEYREYEFITVYKYSGGISRFGLRMTKQKFAW